MQSFGEITSPRIETTSVAFKHLSLFILSEPSYEEAKNSEDIGSLFRPKFSLDPTQGAAEKPAIHAAGGVHHPQETFGSMEKKYWP